MNNALWEPTHENDDERIDELEQWAAIALEALMKGAELMPLELLGKWHGIRAVIESCPIEISHTNKD